MDQESLDRCFALTVPPLASFRPLSSANRVPARVSATTATVDRYTI
jgi:hypothetical protein